mmetsp:Transcript_101983/g.266182  ORF Transcript_101983/g.266182 Transcript_101983/m.266182 type:complete len:95 (-) Transcript_101983:140-424(-)
MMLTGGATPAPCALFPHYASKNKKGTQSTKMVSHRCAVFCIWHSTANKIAYAHTVWCATQQCAMPCHLENTLKVFRALPQTSVRMGAGFVVLFL